MSKSITATALAFILMFQTTLAQEADPFADLLPSDDTFLDSSVDDIFGNLESPADIAETANLSNSTSGLPLNASVTLNVTNISMDDTDAQKSGARAGDVLHYEFTLNSQNDDVNNFVPRFDVSGLVGKVDFTELGLGQLSGNEIIFPSYSNKAPCEQTFGFFVQIKDCEELSSKNLMASIEGQNASLAVSCGLTPTGPSQYLMYGSIFAMIMLSILFFITRRRA